MIENSKKCQTSGLLGFSGFSIGNRHFLKVDIVCIKFAPHTDEDLNWCGLIVGVCACVLAHTSAAEHTIERRLD